MAQVINTNVPSLNSQNQLTKSQSSLTTSLQRISSGLRINSAKDDAAGLAISARMTSQINGNTQASRNASDGISLAQTAEGSLQSVTDSLQRMRELAVQSSNASNTDTDRKAIQIEVDQLVQQINTVAGQSSFNGVKLLDGTFNSQVFQVGANSGETITVSSIASAKADSLGVGSTSSYYKELTAAAVTGGTLSAGSITVNGYSLGASSSDGVSSSVSITGAVATAFATPADDITAGDLKINGVAIGAITGGAAAPAQGTAVATAINLLTGSTGVSATADAAGKVTLTSKDGKDIKIEQSGTATTARTGLTAGTTAVGSDSAIAKAAAFNALSGKTGVSATATATTRTGAAAGTLTAVTAGDIKINGIDIGAVADGATNVEKGSNVAAAINAVSNQTGVTATFSTTDGAVTLNAADGRTISAEIKATGAGGGLGIASTAATQNTYGGIKINTTSSAGITLGGSDIGKAGLSAGYTASVATFGAGVSKVDVTTSGGAQNAIATIDAALAQVNTSRANLGAIQNRFGAVVTNLATTSENLSSSRSRILDADFAAETANLTRSQILQQAGTAMLSQANSLPQGVLSLLK